MVACWKPLHRPDHACLLIYRSTAHSCRWLVLIGKIRNLHSAEIIGFEVATSDERPIIINPIWTDHACVSKCHGEILASLQVNSDCIGLRYHRSRSASDVVNYLKIVILLIRIALYPSCRGIIVMPHLH